MKTELTKSAHYANRARSRALHLENVAALKCTILCNPTKWAQNYHKLMTRGQQRLPRNPPRIGSRRIQMYVFRSGNRSSMIVSRSSTNSDIERFENSQKLSLATKVNFKHLKGIKIDKIISRNKSTTPSSTFVIVKIYGRFFGRTFLTTLQTMRI